MTSEDKELLLKDLCARLPYGVKCKVDGISQPMPYCDKHFIDYRGLISKELALEAPENMYKF